MNEEEIKEVVESIMETHEENRETMLRNLLFHTIMGHELVLLETREQTMKNEGIVYKTSYKYVFRTPDAAISDEVEGD